MTPTEYRADAVVAFYETPEAENPAFAVVFEAQRRTDRAKRRSWPVYVATTHARHDCPTTAVAEWAAQPISTGDPGLLLTPMALDLDQMPVIPEGPIAREFPHLAVLSAGLAHRRPARRDRHQSDDQRASAGVGVDQRTSGEDHDRS